jgi:hypothetical protein
MGTVKVEVENFLRRFLKKSPGFFQQLARCLRDQIWNYAISYQGAIHVFGKTNRTNKHLVCVNITFMIAHLGVNERHGTGLISEPKL